MAAAGGLVLIQPVQMQQLSCVAVSLIGTNVENNLDWKCLLGALIIVDMLTLSPFRVNKIEMGMQKTGRS